MVVFILAEVSFHFMTRSSPTWCIFIVHVPLESVIDVEVEKPSLTPSTMNELTTLTVSPSKVSSMVIVAARLSSAENFACRSPGPSSTIVRKSIRFVVITDFDTQLPVSPAVAS